MHVITIIVLALIYTFAVSAFNISPKPNLIIQEPTIGRYRPKSRSSYFGFSLLLKLRSLFVGAPRAQTTIESQKNINETGLLYKCSLELGSSGHCVVYLIDKTGNKNSEDNDGNPENEKKDYQWLGGSLDGGSKDSEPLIVCAPRMIDETSEHYYMHGICYRTPNTVEEQPTSIKSISPLKGSDNQIWGESFLYAYGESGFSVHWTGENDEVLIGAPGINDWKGSLIRYRAEENKGHGGIAKRDLNNQINLENNVKGSFKSSIPNSNLWHQSNDSYFGYSESSGYFNVDSTKKLLYITSAPRANNYDGEVYVYDIINDSRPKTYNLKKYQTFSGKQFGEYFGFSVLTDDLNGDGLTDIIISAPLYTKANIYDCGAVYVYINGNNLVFEEQLIISPDKSSGRFGTSISLLGDINQDGFNDIAISAPFSGDGKVFIYLGNKKGLQNKPSQVIIAPKIDNLPNQHMFGYGLSKGLDIDGNGYNDLAIGAPNAEMVYLFKTYPIVKVFGTIDAVSREIQADQKDLKIRVCFKMIPNSENSNKKIDQKLKVKIEADVYLQRVKFQDGNNYINDIINLKSELNECKVFDAYLSLNLQDIFKPIELKMNYDLINKVPNTEEFCEKCFALDPSIENFMTKKISFNTGCAGEICEADLSISSKLSNNFVIGSNNIIEVQYIIRNDGETAYVPQLNVTSSNAMSFAKIPSMCIRHSIILICDINHGQPMHRGKSDSITITFDSSSIDVKVLSIIAIVSSTGKEKNLFDNSVDNIITIQERSSLDIIRTNQNQMITLEDQSGMNEILSKFEIKNNGPSPIKEATFSISVPLSYLIPKTTKRVTIIDIKNITFAANYNSFNLNPTFYKNGTNILLEAQKKGKQVMMITSSISDDLHASKYDSSKFSFDLENLNNDHTNNEADRYLNRKRRSMISNSEVQVNGSEFERFTEKKIINTISHELTGTLPLSKIIDFNCQDPDESDCVHIIIKLNNFRVSNERGVNIELKYIVDLDEVNNILVEEKTFFFIANQFNVSRIGDQLRESLEVSNEIQYIVISKHRLSSTPIWVIILSILAGLLLLALIIFGLYKFGFFERKKANGTESEGNEVSQPMISQQNNATET